jgi:NAD(P)-dependent dehydrogenase (short-subunit alcohol dehydrogenase family)
VKLITGASRGIGKYLFEHYSSLGEDVSGTWHTSPVLDERIAKVDVTDYAQVDRWVSSLPASRRHDLTLIACAGISFAAMTHKSDPREWAQVIETNLIGAFHAIRCVLPIMREQSFGRIICFSSVVAELPVPGTSAYAASKAALWGLVRTVAAENASRNVTANCITLGYSSIGMGEAVLTDKVREAMLSRIPSGRFCDPDEILRSVEFLTNTPYVTGSCLQLNGGLI